MAFIPFGIQMNTNPLLKIVTMKHIHTHTCACVPARVHTLPDQTYWNVCNKERKGTAKDISKIII